MEATFTILMGPEAGRAFTLAPGNRAVVGRASGSEFQVVADGVSRTHCVLEHTGESVLLTDCGSHNGTWVNEHKTLTCHLQEGDRIRMGLVTLEVHISQPPLSSTVRTSPLFVECADEDAVPVARPRASSPELPLLAAETDHGTTVDEVTRLNHALADLCRVGLALNAEPDLERLFRTIIDIVLRTTRGERGAILLYNAATGSIDPVAGGLWGESRSIRVNVSHTVVAEVLTQGTSVLSADTLTDPRFQTGDSIRAMDIRSVMCVPLRNGTAILGALYVDTTEPLHSFRPFDLDILASIGAQAGVAIERARLIESLEELFLGSIRALIASIEARDPYTRGHSERVTAYALSIADVMGLGPEDREVAELAGLLHDVGKIGVPESLLNKPDKLTDEEYLVIQRHPAQGELIVRHVPHRFIDRVALAVRHHHERWDGKGYPDQLPRDCTSLTARILSVADTWDAMTSDRPYRKGFPDAKALAILQGATGTQLDPTVVKAFLDARNKGWIAEASRLEGPALRCRYLRRPTGQGRSIVHLTASES